MTVRNTRPLEAEDFIAMIQQWRSLAILHGQQGHLDEVERLTRLADQTETIMHTTQATKKPVTKVVYPGYYNS